MKYQTIIKDLKSGRRSYSSVVTNLHIMEFLAKNHKKTRMCKKIMKFAILRAQNRYRFNEQKNEHALGVYINSMQIVKKEK